MYNLFKFIYEGLLIYTFALYVLFEYLLRSFWNTVTGKKETVLLHGKSVLVTGAAGGVGFGLAEVLFKEGCNLALVDINKEALERAAHHLKEARQGPGKVRFYVCNVGNPQDVSNTISAVRKDFSIIDILINNAGVSIGKGILDESFSEIQRTMSVNTMAHFLLIKEILPHMIAEGGGHIVSVASILGLLGFAPSNADYVASKFAAVGLMEAVDYELHAKGIHTVSFTTVCPYMVQTPMFAGAIPSRFSNFESILSVDYVADQVVKGIKEKKRLVILPPKQFMYVLARMLLPRSVAFRLLDFLEVNTSMTRFVGRGSVGSANGH